MPKFKVLSPLDLDNKRIEPGKVVEIDDDTAAPLLAVAAIEPISSKKAAAEAALEAGGDGK